MLNVKLMLFRIYVYNVDKTALTTFLVGGGETTKWCEEMRQQICSIWIVKRGTITTTVWRVSAAAGYAPAMAIYQTERPWEDLKRGAQLGFFSHSI